MKVESIVPEDRPWQTDWIFTIEEDEVFSSIEEFVKEYICDLYERWRGSNLGMIPAQGEIDEEGGWCWGYCGGFEEIPIFCDRNKKQVVLTIDNQPDSDFDKLDPADEGWFSTSKMQWLKVAAIMRKLLQGGSLFRLEGLELN